MVESAKRKISTRDLAILPIFSVLTAIGAFIRIPIGIVPVSLQTVFVVLSALLLGKKAFYSQLIYVLLGLMGLPVFTGGGGIGYIFTPTFGYLLGFMAAAYIMGSLKEKLTEIKFYKLALISLVGLVVIYSFGVSYLYLLKNFLLPGAPMGLYDAIRYGALLFLPMDTLWCLFGAFLSTRLLKHPYLSKN